MPDLLLRFSRMSPLIRAPLLALLGAIAALGQAPWGWPLVTMLGLVLIFALPITPWKSMALNGWSFGAGYFAIALHWITQPFMVDAARDGWMAPFALILMATGLALFWGGAFGLARALGGGKLALVTCWTGAEVARSLLFTGFPWALIGHIWIDTPLAQLAAFVGPHGLTMLTLGAAAMLAASRVWPVAPLVLAGIGWITLDPGPAPASDPAAPLIRLVQPNIPQQDKWKPDLVPLHFQRLLDLTAAGPIPDLVIWPETAIPWILDQAQGVLESSADAAHGAPLIMGVQRRADGRYYNSLALLDRVGAVSGVYDKSHLAPFGEYMPLGEVMAQFGIHGLASSEGGGFSSGAGLKLIEVPGIGPVLPLICYEGIFAEEVNAVPGRARLMVLITNDAWFGTDAGPYQHFALARLRAIEQALPLARVANTGVSGMIDARGRVLGQISLGAQGAIDLPLPAALPPTLYSKAGDWPALVLLTLLTLGLIATRRRIVVDPATRPD